MSEFNLEVCHLSAMLETEQCSESSCPCPKRTQRIGYSEINDSRPLPFRFLGDQSEQASELTVQVWHAVASESQPGIVERHCECWLDDEDRQRTLRLKRDTTRNQHVIGRGMMRQLLSTSGVHPQSIRFATLPHGRPIVQSPAELRRPFNVSHTGGLVLGGLVDANAPLAVDRESGDGLVGVDVERIDRCTDVALAERYFSAPEVAYVRSHRNVDAQREAFLRVWTLKESFIKAIGTGLSTPLADFAFRDIESDAPWIEMLDPRLESEVHWRFFPFVPRPGFIAAVAVGCQHRETPTSIEVRCFEDLLA